MNEPQLSSDIADTIRGWIADAKRIVALTGAGISTESGIPDYRGPNGVWTRNPEAEKLATLQNYLADAEVRKASWQSRLDHPAYSAKPNNGHRALVSLERLGKLHGLITQNVDGLHRLAGNTADKVIEVHGNLHGVMCFGCDWKGPMAQVLERVRRGEADPACERCGGILKSDTISFGQALVPAVIDKAMRVAEQCDLMFAIGSTLQVYPVAHAVPLAKSNGARLVIINAQPTQFDDIADAVLRGSIGQVLPSLCAG